MKIETKYNLGDIVFFNQYGSIEKGKITDLYISANKSDSVVMYEVNTAPAWTEVFSYAWRRYTKSFTENELYSSLTGIAEKDIAELQLEIDIRNEKINKIKQQLLKEQVNN